MIKIEVKSQSAFCKVVGLREYLKFLPQLQLLIRCRKRHYNQDIDVLQNSRKVRRSLFGSCRRVIVVIPR